MNYALLRAFGQAFRTPDLRKKMLFVLFIVLLFRLGSAIPAPGVSEKNIHTCLVAGHRRQQRERLHPDQPLQRWRLAEAVDSGAGHHALHHVEHHHSASRRGDPAARAVEARGPVRSGEADAVHALPHDRVGDPSVVCLRGAGAHPWSDLHGMYDADHSERRLAGDPDHRPDDDGGHRDHHVARRAHHRPRHRQRHVDPDLHPDRRAVPVRAQQHPADQGPLHLLDGDRGRCRHHRGHRVRRAGATTHPGAVRETDDRPPNVWRYVDLPAIEGEPGRCHPGHLRVVPAVYPFAVDARVERQPRLHPVRHELPVAERAPRPTCCSTQP